MRGDEREDYRHKKEIMRDFSLPSEDALTQSRQSRRNHTFTVLNACKL
jgi:hypothetical protein